MYMCVVRVHGETQSTEVQKNVLSATFDHLMFFSFRMTASQFNRGKVTVEVSALCVVQAALTATTKF